MTQGVNKTFSDRMRELQAQAATNYRSLRAETQRLWQTPAADQSSALRVQDIGKTAFDRSELNAEYEELVNGTAASASCGEVLALRLQIAAVAAEERAYRHRHMSVARAICTAHGRCYGQGFGELFSPKGIEGDVAAYLQAGSARTT